MAGDLKSAGDEFHPMGLSEGNESPVDDNVKQHNARQRGLRGDTFFAPLIDDSK